MKTTFKKIAAISLATLTLACASCFTSFAAENENGADKKNGDFVYEDIFKEYENGMWDYGDDTYVYYEEIAEYDNCFFIPGDYLARE